jgi:3-hydroxyacyl-CoA dehydrogenase
MIEYTVSDGLGILHFQSPPVNAISFALLDALRSLLRQANQQPEVQAIVITGGPQYFSAGADLAIFQDIRSGEDAVRTSRIFQEAFQEIEDSPKPVVAAVAGHVLGGALELAMACHFRVAAQRSRFSMPEVRLGINPGAGGTQRLPRLVGAEAALEMLLSSRPIDAEEALRLGLIDAIARPDELVSCVADVLRRWVPRLACPTVPSALLDEPAVAPHPRQWDCRTTRQRMDKIVDAAANRAAIAKAQQRATAGPAEIIAPRKIIEALQAGLEESFAAGLLAEQEAFRQCMATRAAQNKIYIFCASRQTGKLAGIDTVPSARIATAGVLGMGTMGTGIAQALLAAGISVTACDENETALSAARQKIQASLEKRVREGKLAPADAERTSALLRTSTDYRQLSGAELVIEAVFEKTEVKQAALGRLEEVCSPETLIGSNTSTLDLDQLAQRMQHPERLLGMHFFHPAQRMPLLEIVRRETTPLAEIATAIQLARRLGKTPVVVRNREGFLVNRLFVPYLKEAFWLLEDGAEPTAIDRAMVAFGFAMGPLALIDMSGLDILVLTDAVLRSAFSRHGPLSPIALRLVDEGHLGQKTGSGVYRYEHGDHTPRPSETAERIIQAARRQRGAPAGPMCDEEIVRRLMLRMVAEAFCVLEEKIVERGADIDVAMVLGTGLPDFRGGVLKYACDLGLDRVLVQLDELAATHGDRFAPCRLLREAAASTPLSLLGEGLGVRA